MADPPYPLFGCTWTLHRVSELFHGDSHILSDIACQIHARRLKDALRGDYIRGVDVAVGGEDTSLRNAGSLLDCSWDLLGDEAQWTSAHRTRSENDEDDASDISDSPEAVDADNTRGIHIQLQFEKTSYGALLLRRPSSRTSMAGYTALPLLLVRMPAALQKTFIDHLSRTFDCRISPMKLRTNFLTSSIEQILHDLTTASLPPLEFQSAIKSVQLQLGFPHLLTPELLRSVDITIAKEEIEIFLNKGRELPTQPLLAEKSHREPTVVGPFTRALAAYFKSHMAIDLLHKSITIKKLACAVFALAGEGKLKLFQPQLEVANNTSRHGAKETTPKYTAFQALLRNFYDLLLAEAEFRREPFDERRSVLGKGKSKRLAEDGEDGPRRKKVLGRDALPERLVPVPAEPPPPYELHDPARH
ncbi:hypothetical protein K402DRAFT_416092 [Aulographum hederae CBS 113979]|uniref:Uncharacterized protein n=1 Tax=Aulographum hederae CBS 113979 TaxID=1176131 RepID=A0A6G1HHC5_9PEZI|nr:hypothetical protein K402DRAFT_416092 [Aulographum hederae CBS 113979]